jgi:Mitochondrial domain of unknown function (DUF1713)
VVQAHEARRHRARRLVALDLVDLVDLVMDLPCFATAGTGLVGSRALAPTSVAQAMGSLIKKRRKRMRKKKHKKMLKKTRWQRRAAGK